MCINTVSHEEACRLDTYTNRQRQLWTPHLRRAMLIQSDWVQGPKRVIADALHSVLCAAAIM